MTDSAPELGEYDEEHAGNSPEAINELSISAIIEMTQKTPAG
jgi:hypothetical protein